MVSAIEPEQIMFIMPDGSKVSALVRKSARARKASIALFLNAKLVLTVPASLPDHEIRQLPAHFIAWVEKLWRKGELKSRHLEVPDSIVLPLLAKNFILKRGMEAIGGKITGLGNEDYLLFKAGGKRILVTATGSELCLHGHHQDSRMCILALQAYVRKLAQIHLPDFIGDISASIGAGTLTVKVRNQGTRWGSCSKNPAAPFPVISINWRALLLSRQLLEHLCLHELTHLIHMNHSAAFYKELEKYSPNWKISEKALSCEWRHLPAWTCHFF